MVISDSIEKLLLDILIRRTSLDSRYLPVDLQSWLLRMFSRSGVTFGHLSLKIGYAVLSTFFFQPLMTLINTDDFQFVN